MNANIVKYGKAILSFGVMLAGSVGVVILQDKIEHKKFMQNLENDVSAAREQFDFTVLRSRKQVNTFFGIYTLDIFT